MGPSADSTTRRRLRFRARGVPALTVALASLLTLTGCGLYGGDDADGAAPSESRSDTRDPTGRPPSDATAQRSAPPSTRPEPEAPRPARGDCRRLGWRDTRSAVTDAGSVPVRCSRPHTGETFARGTLDAVRGAGGTLRLRRPSGTSAECRAALVDWLGGDEEAYELSMFAYAVAVPPKADRAAGARWWRCDAFATDRQGELTRLHGTTRRALRGTTADGWATCVRGTLGANPQQVLCREPHHWRAVSAHRLGGRGADYPGRNVVAERMRDTCMDEVGAYEGDPLEGFDYGWLRPTLEDWRNGQRFGLCFARTRD